MFLRRLTPPHSSWEGPQVTNFDQCLQIVMVIWKSADVSWGIFRLLGGGLREGDMLGELSLRNSSWGKKGFMKGEQDFLALF